MIQKSEVYVAAHVVGRNPTDDVVSAVISASRVLVAVSARSLAEAEDTVTLTQFRTLVVLASRGHSSLNVLADTLGVNSSTAMRTIDRLIRIDLVSRAENPANRREVLLSLTVSGERLVEDVTSRRRQAITAILGRMTGRKRSDLISAFRAFTVAAEEPDLQPGSPVSLGW